MTRVVEVLLVEDDPGDVLMTREAFDLVSPTTRLSVVRDGAAAVDHLRRRAEHVGAPLPDLILLDLNLPRMDGREVLAEVKGDPVLRGIPVVVLSTSSAEEDMRSSYALHASAFVTKPVDFDRLVEVVRQIDRVFLSAARLPAG